MISPNDITVNVIASIIASAFFLVAGFIWGKYKERRRKFGRKLEEYDFYPFTVSRENFGEFNLNNFRLGMHYFLKNEDQSGALADYAREQCHGAAFARRSNQPADRLQT